MMKLRSLLISKTWKAHNISYYLGILLFIHLLIPTKGFTRIFIDINAPSIQRIKIAIPDFTNLSTQKEHPELSRALSEVVSNDLDLSGYFTPMDREAFLDEDDSFSSEGEIRFKNWSVIGAELLLKGAYTCTGRSLEVEVRLFDVFWGRQLLGRRVLGKIGKHRSLMHRIGNEVISILTGHEGMFLSKLAFVGTSSGPKEIYISDYDGHNVRQITSDRNIALFPVWSPQGDKIAYSSLKDGGHMLFITDISTGKVRRISARKGLNIGAAWAPDGRKLALTLTHKGNPEIYVIDLTGKIIDRLTYYWGIDGEPAFSPDGKKIAFVSDRSGGSPQIYVKDLITGKDKRLTFTSDMLIGRYNTSPAWSSLDRIAFSGMINEQINIYTMDSDGSNLRRLTYNQGRNEEPCWSADGRYIVFSSNRDGGYHLYIMNANGQNQRRITFSKGEETSPSWSPW
jgi:TolB protein